MKLNKIASAIAIIGFGLCSAAWSQTVGAVDTVNASGNLIVNTPYVKEVKDVNGVVTTPGQILNVTSTPLVAPTTTNVTGTRIDAPSTKTGAVGNVTTNSFVTPTATNLGNSTNPNQSTLGGPGGVSGFVTVNTATTVYAVGNTIKKDTKYEAGSFIGGVEMLAPGTLAADTTAVANDKVIATPKTAIGSGAIGAGIKGTDHDFATKVVSESNTASVGLCTYCHTPHKAASTLLLWNKSMSTNATFKWDVAATTAGTALPSFSGSTYSGPSAKCLACHDGSVAIGDIGWFAGAGRTGAAALNTKTMKDLDQRFVMGADGQLGAGSTFAPAGAAAFGGSAVHPVAIPYPLNGAPNVYNGSVTGARLATADFVADPTGNNIRLYTDVGGGSIVGKVTPGKTGIECSSCHDVHNKAATDKYFLRGKMVGSSLADGYICAQCHTK